MKGPCGENLPVAWLCIYASFGMCSRKKSVDMGYKYVVYAFPMKEPKLRGRPITRREQAVVGVAEALGLHLEADILTLEDMKEFPDIRKESKRNQAVMCMVACGFPQSHIAEAFGLARPTVFELVNRIDPNGAFKIDPQAKKAILTRLVEGRAMSAVSSITYEDLLELDADKRASVAQKMIRISQDLNTTKHKELASSKLDLIMDAVEKENGVFEVEVEK